MNPYRRRWIRIRVCQQGQWADRGGEDCTPGQAKVRQQHTVADQDQGEQGIQGWLLFYLTNYGCYFICLF